jgi:hypothetical protein
VGAEGDGGTVGERQRDRAVAQWGSRARRRDRAGRQPVVGGWSFVLPPSPFVLRPSPLVVLPLVACQPVGRLSSPTK